MKQEKSENLAKNTQNRVIFKNNSQNTFLLFYFVLHLWYHRREKQKSWKLLKHTKSSQVMR
jgi:hypothetical protein